MIVTAEKIQQLNEWAEGSLPLMAAARLLTQSPQRESLWPVLTRKRHDDRPWLAVDSAHTYIDEFGLSSGERAVALLVLELAGRDTGVALADLLCRLDPANAREFHDAARILTGHSSWMELAIAELEG